MRYEKRGEVFNSAKYDWWSGTNRSTVARNIETVFAVSNQKEERDFSIKKF